MSTNNIIDMVVWLVLMAALAVFSVWRMPKPGTLRFNPAAGVWLRNERQALVHSWCVAAFGIGHASSVKQRGVRLAEEAIELAQACEVDPEMLHKLIDYVYAKAPGNIAQEIGGVGVTLLALAHAAGVSADEAEDAEFRRVLSKPFSHFAARNAAKNDAGFNVTPGDDA